MVVLGGGMQQFNPTRRAVMVAAVAAPAGGALVLNYDVKAAIDVLERALRRQHGGLWSAHFDAVNGFALITRTDPARLSV